MIWDSFMVAPASDWIWLPGLCVVRGVRDIDAIDAIDNIVGTFAARPEVARGGRYLAARAAPYTPRAARRALMRRSLSEIALRASGALAVTAARNRPARS
ncbi:hypothetical protein FHX57_003156 [Paraburkholderia tropica]|jgi:hypothetical protein|uniref:hypothetical protein n=1 Tax=Paraburkholderia tropica TaxID=92647 RepID=UPI001615862E|nr:hypothetical protein [Paraburkholderia tropica]MBB3000804.1 hypothetical protein [Paraburkholderia tropica]MBB6319408.1 hypothetical protein [Paraburkholderia tropica]